MTSSHVRIVDPIDETRRSKLVGNLHPKAVPENDAGPVDPNTRFERMILALRSDREQTAALDAFLDSPKHESWLTPLEFEHHFGVDRQDIASITNWLHSHGFTVDEVPAGARSVIFSGTVAQVQEAFHTDIHHYVVNGERHIANTTDPEIPIALASVVAGVVSLHDFRSHPLHHMHRASPADTASGGAHYLSAADFQTIYNTKPLYASGINGSGQTIAIIGQSDVVLANVQQFRTVMGLPANNPQVVPIYSDPGSPPADQGESYLDLEWAGAVAPNALILFYTSGGTATMDGVTAAAQYAVTQNQADVISLSYGSCEQGMGSGYLNFIYSLWQQAAAQGISVFVSSGDAGAAGCDDPHKESVATNGRAVNGLCSSPYSTCVGGTEFNDAGNPSLYWSASNSPTLESALGYIPEVVWNDSASNGGSGIWSSGGGASAFWSKPNWQNTPGVPADGMRDVPDVSLTASLHDGYLTYPCPPGFTCWSGGTSAAAPSFAGIMALVAQQLGRRLGSVNPTLYAMANRQIRSGSAGPFHYITSGNNSVPGVVGFSASTAAAAYNQATGLGSVDATALAGNWDSWLSPAPKSFAMGGSVAFAIRNDGTLVSWGTDTGGGLGNGSANWSITPVPVALPSGAKAVTVAVGSTDSQTVDTHALAIATDGFVYAWGQNGAGQLGNAVASTNSLTPVRASLPVGLQISTVAVGDQTSFAIGSNGSIYGWGANWFGQLGSGTSTTYGTATPSPLVVALPSGVHGLDIASSEDFSLAIGSDGNVYSWGIDDEGQLGNGTISSQYFWPTPNPVQLPSGVTAIAIAAGYTTGYAIGNDGKLYAWGDGSVGQLGNGALESTGTPVVVSMPAAVTATGVAAAGSNAYAIGSDGNLYAWGSAYGNGATAASALPVAVKFPPGVVAQAISAGSFGRDPTHVLVLGSDGRLYGFGGYSGDTFGAGTYTLSLLPIFVYSPQITSPIAAGTGHVLRIGPDGNLYAWGDNAAGQLGNGTTTNSSSPVAVTLPASVTARSIFAGNAHNLMIGSDGNLYSWGYNAYGQLGNGSTSNSLTPTIVTLAPAVTPKNIAAGIYHSLAIGSDGKLYTWGDNANGQLGNGTTVNSSTPAVVSLAPGVNALAVSGGLLHSLAIGNDGNTYAWGDNAYGELGNGSSAASSAVPVVVKFPLGVSAVAIASAYAYNLALGNDGVLYAWGHNSAGQLGDGTTTNRSTPVAIALPAGVTAQVLAAGGLNTLVLGSDGKLYAWGDNTYGELGNGGTTSSLTATSVSLPAGVGVSAIANGDNFGFVIGTDGNLYSWGYNFYGQLGNGATSNGSTPTVAQSLRIQYILNSFIPVTTASLSSSPITMSATPSLGGTVNYASITPSVCSASATSGLTNSSLLTLLSPGVCVVAATLPGNAEAASFQRTEFLTVSPSPASVTGQSIIFSTIANTSSGFTVALFATASSGLPITFSSLTPSICSVSGSLARTITVGTCTIAADQPGNAIYAAAAEVTQSFTVTPSLQQQVITFASIPDQTLGALPFAVVATASSGLSVAITSRTSSVCTMSGDTVMLIASGTCKLAADQAGNSTYASAATVIESFTVLAQLPNLIAQKIIFNPPGAHVLHQTFDLVATGGGSNNPVLFVVTTPSVCSVKGIAATTLGRGTCRITAYQSASITYSAATPVTRSFTVFERRPTGP